MGILDGYWEIYYWDGTSTINISNDTAYGMYPSLYDGEIAWSSSADGDYEIYYARLASSWIRDALPELSDLDLTESEIMELADLYSSQSSGLVGDISWTYYSGNLPGDTDGEVYEIGDSWIYEGNYYIKLGSGLEGNAGAAVPEMPIPQAVMFLLSFFVLRRKKKVRS